MYVKVTVEESEQVGLRVRLPSSSRRRTQIIKSSIWVGREERRVNAKSLLGVLGLGIVSAFTIRMLLMAPNEQAAIDGLVKLVELRHMR